MSEKNCLGKQATYVLKANKIFNSFLNFYTTLILNYKKAIIKNK